LQWQTLNSTLGVPRVGQTLTWADKALIFATLLLIGLLWRSAPAGRGTYVRLESQGVAVGEWVLSQKRVERIKGAVGESRIEIADGRVRFIDGPCQHRLCVRQGWLERPGEIAVCLPNRVVCIIGATGSSSVSDSDSGPDAISQ
jgi:hypothetical protein